MASLTRTKMELVREAWKDMSPREIRQELSPRLGLDATLEERGSLFEDLMKSPMLSDPSLADKVLEAVFMTPPNDAAAGLSPVSSHPRELDVLGADFQRLGASVRPILEDAIKWESTMGSARRAVWANPLRQSLEVVKSGFADADATLSRFGGTCACAICEGVTRARTEAENLIVGCQGMLEGKIYADGDVKELADRHVERQGRPRPGRLAWITAPSRPAPSRLKVHNFNGIPGILPSPSPKPKHQGFRRLMDDPPDDNYDPRWPCNHREYEATCPACSRAIGKKNEKARELEAAKRRQEETRAKLERAENDLYWAKVEKESADARAKEVESSRKRVEKEKKDLEAAKRRQAQLASDLSQAKKDLEDARYDQKASEMKASRREKRERDERARQKEADQKRAKEQEAAERTATRQAAERQAKETEVSEVKRQIKEAMKEWEAAKAATDAAIKSYSRAQGYFDKDIALVGGPAARYLESLKQTKVLKQAAEARCKRAVEQLRARLVTITS